jgi:hypothetical protein
MAQGGSSDSPGSDPPLFTTRDLAQISHLARRAHDIKRKWAKDQFFGEFSEKVA